MRWQTTAVLAVLLIGLGAFYYVYEIRLAPEREKTQSRKGRVFSVETGDVTEVTLKRAQDTIRLKRDADGWQMLEPVAARGERGPIEETITSVVMAKQDREIAAQPANLGEFGLDKPAAEVTLVLKDGKQLGLLLGGKNPTGVWVYAQERGKPPVFVLGDSVLRDSIRPLADFRNKAVLAFERRDVTGLVVVTPDETLAVEAAGDNKWKLTRPRPLEADTETIVEFLDKLAASRVKEFATDAPKSLQLYGLERPVRLSIQVGKDKDRAIKELLLGSVDDKKKGVYAMRPGEQSVLLLPDEVWTLLPRTTAAVRNKNLIELDRDKVERLDLESPRGNITLVREGDKWRITQPETLPADPVQAGAVLQKLKSLRAQGFLSDDAAAIARYLPRPEVRATVTVQGNPMPLTVLLAPSPEKRGGQPMSYAAVAGRGPVVLVEGTAPSDVGRALNDLRDHTLVGGLEPRDVKRIQVKGGGKALVFERVSDTEWKIVDGAKGSAKSPKVDDVLFALRGLRWKELMAPGAEEPARYGLDTPAAEIGLYRADGTEIATVVLGKQDGDRRYLKLKSAPTVYSIDAKALEIPKIPDDFLG